MRNSSGLNDAFLHQCWSCKRQFKTGDGVSIRDDEEEQVCLECWATIPADKRLMISWLFRTSEDGGAGIPNFITQMIDSLVEMGWKRLLEKQGGSEN